MSKEFSGKRRAVDIVVSLTAVVTLAPIMVIVAVASFVSSGGPVFYTQTRVGRNGHLFRILKFRTMKRLSEPYGPQLSHKDDPRITVFGKTLRRFHIDEIPQFINVLKGDMTLIGYRPERPFYVAKVLKEYPDYSELLKTKPGLVSIGVLDFGYASDIDQLIERAEMDVSYLRERTGLEDLKLVGKTLVTVFRGKGI